MIFDPEGTLSYVRPDTVEEKTKGGIWLPESTKDDERLATTTGVIIAIGPAADIEFAEGAAKVGDHVIYAKWSGRIVRDKDTGIEYRLIDHKDYMARI